MKGNKNLIIIIMIFLLSIIVLSSVNAIDVLNIGFESTSDGVDGWMPVRTSYATMYQDNTTYYTGLSSGNFLTNYQNELYYPSYQTPSYAKNNISASFMVYNSYCEEVGIIQNNTEHDVGSLTWSDDCYGVGGRLDLLIIGIGGGDFGSVFYTNNATCGSTPLNRWINVTLYIEDKGTDVLVGSVVRDTSGNILCRIENLTQSTYVKENGWTPIISVGTGSFGFSNVDNIQMYNIEDLTPPPKTCNVCNETCTPCSPSIDGLCNGTSMNAMYHNVVNFTQTYGDITGFNTTCITNMDGTFLGSDFNQDISNWDVSHITTMKEMFWRDTTFNQPIGKWNTKSLTNTNYMFVGDNFNQNISNWNVEHLATAKGMFYQSGLSKENYDDLLNKWSTQNVNIFLTIDFGNSQYTNNGEDARDILVNNKFWMITDAGLYVPPCIENWIEYNTTCNQTTQNYTKYYLDNNTCGTYNNIPIDNNTYYPCIINCTENWITHLTTCNLTTGNQTKYYTDNNMCGTYNSIPNDNNTFVTCQTNNGNNGYVIKSVDAQPIINVIIALFIIVLITSILIGFFSGAFKSDVEDNPIRKYIIIIVVACIVILLIYFLWETFL